MLPVSQPHTARGLPQVTRDRLMLQLDQQYPQFGFAQHKGYGVPAHMQAIRAHGPCDVHRRSFEPVKGITGWVRPKPVAAAAPPSATQLELPASGEAMDSAGPAEHKAAPPGGARGKRKALAVEPQPDAAQTGGAAATAAEAGGRVRTRRRR